MNKMITEQKDKTVTSRRNGIPEAVHLPGGNRLDNILIDIKTSFAHQDQWLSSLSVKKGGGKTDLGCTFLTISRILFSVSR